MKKKTQEKTAGDDVSVRPRIDPRFLKTAGVEAYTGNELLLKGALEAGVALMTGYPGSPVSEVFDAIAEASSYLEKHGMVAQIANNEGLAAARLNGARLAGLRAMAIMKSVGLHVAADALAVGNLMESKKRDGGAVIVVGDDPWNETTQINSDSRYLSEHLHMPLLAPATFQEMKDWISSGFELSGACDLYITYLVTTNQADGGGTVCVRPHPPLLVSSHNTTTLYSDDISIQNTVLIPPHTSLREATLKERFQRFIEKKRLLGLDQKIGPTNKRAAVGFISAGLPCCYLEEVLHLLGLQDELPILKLGAIYPIDPESVLDIASRVDHLIVVEEKRGFIESHVSSILRDLSQSGKLAKAPALWGKLFPDGEKGVPEAKGLNVSIIMESLGPLFLKWASLFPTLDKAVVEREMSEIQHTRSSSFDVPARTPTFCPGCPHRDSAVVGQKTKSKLKQENADMDLLFHGESGCHSMLQFAPNEGLMQDYSGMGLGGGTGAGMSPFVSNKQVVFLGDSTFFHSGMVAISDAVKNNQEITFVILQNDTTAMTGHQPTPGNSRNIMGAWTNSQDIERLLRGMLPEGIPLIRMNPSDRETYQRTFEDTVTKPGVKVIIADKECAITFNRRKTREKKERLMKVGYIRREEKYAIATEVCEYCLACAKETACPGLTVTNTVYGRKLTMDMSTCVDDGACSRTKACPSFEKILIRRKGPAAKKELPPVDRVPSPIVEPFQGRWSAYTAGVGGMGAGVVNSVLVRAGMKEGYHVSFLDKKGLAIRNGGVYGHVVFAEAGPVKSPVIPYGKAELLIGLDALEAARAVDARINLRVAHPSRTRGVINTHKHETVLSLIGREDFSMPKLEEAISARVRLGGYLSADFSALSEEYVGSKLYANMMILGAAYQKGWIPISEKNMLLAIKETVRAADLHANNLAFSIGRRAAVQPEELQATSKSRPLADLVKEKADYIRKGFFVTGASRARHYLKLMDEAIRWMDIPRDSMALLAHTVYDLVRYDRPSLAQTYLQYIWSTYRKDQSQFGYKATTAVILNLHKCMTIKDEVWVSRLLTSPEKYDRDYERHGLKKSQGDRISYRHFNRPRFEFGPWSTEFDVVTSDWMLRIFATLTFLRRILPGWHRHERDFRDWYIGLVNGFTYFSSNTDYETYLKALTLPEEVRGYRELRLPLMDEAKKKAATLLSSLWRQAANASSTVKSTKKNDKEPS